MGSPDSHLPKKLSGQGGWAGVGSPDIRLPKKRSGQVVGKVTGFQKVGIAVVKRAFELAEKKLSSYGCKTTVIQYFLTRFFLPQVLIEIRRFRMFSVMSDHLRRFLPLSNMDAHTNFGSH